MSSLFRTRFAPSPTGYLHVGHAFAAREAFDTARDGNGECLLRIEDTDTTRCRPEYEAAILHDLNWLGFEWTTPFRRQSEHFADYQAALDRLIGLGLVYRCFLSRRELAERFERDGIAVSPAGERAYPGPERIMSNDEAEARAASGEAANWRLSLSRCRDHLAADWDQLGFEETGKGPNGEAGWISARPEWLGDVILARKDTPTSYHLSACHDDAEQGITHIIRGADVFHSTHIHVLLQALFSWPVPVYRHHGLVMGADGCKLSKSDHAKSLRALRQEGLKPSQIFQNWTLS